MKLLLINGETGQVGTSTHMSGNLCRFKRSMQHPSNLFI